MICSVQGVRVQDRVVSRCISPSSAWYWVKRPWLTGGRTQRVLRMPWHLTLAGLSGTDQRVVRKVQLMQYTGTQWWCSAAYRQGPPYREYYREYSDVWVFVAQCEWRKRHGVTIEGDECLALSRV